MNVKEQIETYFSEGKYHEVIELCSQILNDDKDNSSILLNRIDSYIKINKYDEALIDAIHCTKINPDLVEYWEKLGIILYNQCDYSDALIVYNKANELNPCDEYEKMILEIKKKISTNSLSTNSLPNDSLPTNSLPTNSLPTNSLPNDSLPTNSLPNDSLPTNSLPTNSLPTNSLPSDKKNFLVEDIFSKMLNTVVDNPKLFEKLSDTTFQSKVLSMQSNPIEALKDQEIIDIMMEMMKGIPK